MNAITFNQAAACLEKAIANARMIRVDYLSYATAGEQIVEAAIDLQEVILQSAPPEKVTA